MTWLTLCDIADMAEGRLIGDDLEVDSVSTDTRGLSANQLFVALRGARFDAQDLVERGRADKAAAVMVASECATARPQILVENTLTGLTRLAKAWRRRLSLPFIGLTGSNGKTTVKEMIASILACRGRVYATRGNLNNHIGVPLTLLSVRAEHDFAVVEMGANRPGEIRGLTEIANPDVALITNAAPAHLEGFGDIEGVARAKGEIFAGLRDAGVAIINADDRFADYWRGLVTRHARLSFGLQPQADISAEWQTGKPLKMITPLGTLEVDLQLQGRHNALNAMAATAAAIAVKADLESVQSGLSSMRPVVGRLVAKQGVNGARIFDDTYNANPASLNAGIEVIASQPGTPWLVLGDMGELGEAAQELHRRAGEMARTAGIERLFALGKFSRFAATTFGAGAQHFDDVNELLMQLKDELRADVTVLIKGSRTMRLEVVVEALLDSRDSSKMSRRGEHAA
jgi:UDP-N-acetylmuramoyl-tripeptide--D-alanyl-D-alanine ligase